MVRLQLRLHRRGRSQLDHAESSMQVGLEVSKDSVEEEVVLLALVSSKSIDNSVDNICSTIGNWRRE